MRHWCSLGWYRCQKIAGFSCYFILTLRLCKRRQFWWRGCSWRSQRENELTDDDIVKDEIQEKVWVLWLLKFVGQFNDFHILFIVLYIHISIYKEFHLFYLNSSFQHISYIKEVRRGNVRIRRLDIWDVLSQRLNILFSNAANWKNRAFENMLYMC